MASHSRIIPFDQFLSTGPYSLLPFRFARRSDGSVFVSNEVGEFVVLSNGDFTEFATRKLAAHSDTYQELRAKHFLTDPASSSLLDQLAAKYRTKKSFLDGFAKLHIVVTTARCNQACVYCQISRRNEHAPGATMSVDVLRRSVDLMLATPAEAVTMEFQGGESLLCFDLVREGVEYARACNEGVGKRIEFVLCTNLVTVTDDQLDFLKKHQVQISTSFDGPAVLHNRNRPLRGGPSHDTVTRNVRRALEALGPGAVSCLMTTTRESLGYARQIVDEYVRVGMRSMFVRELNPYGFAAHAGPSITYSASEFVSFYKEILAYIVRLNREGLTFCESYTTLILSKLLTPWPTGFVDLQSPTGSGFGVVVYNHDGDVYVSDEARMLAEMGEPTFRLGNVLEDSYEQLFFGPTMQLLASAACNEALAGCSDCAYQGYCGADPVRNYRTQGDIYGHRPSSGFCSKNKAIIEHVIDLVLSGDRELERIFWAWIQRDDVANMRLPDPPWLNN